MARSIVIIVAAAMIGLAVVIAGAIIAVALVSRGKGEAQVVIPPPPATRPEETTDQLQKKFGELGSMTFRKQQEIACIDSRLEVGSAPSSEPWSKPNRDELLAKRARLVSEIAELDATLAVIRSKLNQRGYSIPEE